MRWHFHQSINQDVIKLRAGNPRSVLDVTEYDYNTLEYVWVCHVCMCVNDVLKASKSFWCKAERSQQRRKGVVLGKKLSGSP